MKSFFGSLAAASLIVLAPASAAAARSAPAAAAPAGEAAKLAEAHAIIDIMLPPAQRQQMMDKLLSDFTRPIRQNIHLEQLPDAGLRSLVNHFLDAMQEEERPLVQKHIPAQLAAMAVAYTHEFSLGELKEIHAFAQTPTGTHYLSKSLAIVGDPAVMKVNAEIAADTQQFTMRKMAELKTQIVAYVKAHPDVAAKLAAQAKDEAK